MSQSIHLLDERPGAKQVARFLRFCPGLSKHIIGDLLGEHDDFFLQVLDEFTQTFEFQGESRSSLGQPGIGSHGTPAGFREGPQSSQTRCGLTENQGFALGPLL